MNVSKDVKVFNKIYPTNLNALKPFEEESMDTLKVDIPNYKAYNEKKFDVVELKDGEKLGHGQKTYYYEFPEVTAGLTFHISSDWLNTVENNINNELKNGTIKQIEIPERENHKTESRHSGYTDRYVGKKIIENKKPLITMTSLYDKNGHLVEQTHDYKSRRLKGEATHEFFYEKADFLFEAADKYSKLNENELYRNRDIDDSDFISSTLEFFVGKSYTADDFNKMKDEITDIVLELAEQKRKGLEPDLTKVKTNLSIGNDKISISKLFEMQSVGRGLSKAMDVSQVSSDLLAFDYAKMGLSKAFSDYYGNENGAIGKKFAEAMGRVYKSGVENSGRRLRDNYTHIDVKKNNTYGVFHYSERMKTNIKTGMEIAELFADMKTKDKNTMKIDFETKMGRFKNIITDYCKINNIPTDKVGYLSNMNRISSVFHSVLNRL